MSLMACSRVESLHRSVALLQQTVLVSVRNETHMAITKQKKQDIVLKLDESLKNAVSIVFVHFKGLKVADTSAVRKSLKSEGIGYYVAKKTLIRRALTTKGFEGTMPELPGEIALAWSDQDPTVSARGIYDFGKKHKGALSIVGGVFEGSFMDAASMTAIATIPPLPVLRGMFVNVINSPIQGLVVALDKISEKKAA
jgi:large subunit ribosomal protein L10